MRERGSDITSIQNPCFTYLFFLLSRYWIMLRISVPVPGIAEMRATTMAVSVSLIVFFLSVSGISVNSSIVT